MNAAAQAGVLAPSVKLRMASIPMKTLEKETTA